MMEGTMTQNQTEFQQADFGYLSHMDQPTYATLNSQHQPAAKTALQGKFNFFKRSY